MIFYPGARNHVRFFYLKYTRGKMHFKLVENPDDIHAVVYKIARVVYAQTHAASLRLVEAMTSMIANAALQSGRTVSEIVSDEKIFDALDVTSPRHKYLSIDTNNAGFKMCLRTALRMLNGILPDTCNGATRFHNADVLPDWAISIGYIADIDDVLFYL